VQKPAGVGAPPAPAVPGKTVDTMAMLTSPLRPAPAGLVTFGPLTFVPGGKGGRYPYCHSLVVDQGSETWVVDPAANKDYFRALARTRRVTGVFLSHFHEDHRKYNYLFPEAHFYGPLLEAEAFTSLDAIFGFMGITDPRFRDYWRRTLLKDFHFRPPAHFTPYFPGQLFQLGEVILEIIPAPGHTPGHSCFHFPRQQVLFLADVDLTPFGPWYGDAASDLAAFEVTLNDLRDFPARTYLTAHEQGIFSEAEFQAGLAAFHQVLTRREGRLLEALSVPQSLNRLVARRLIYGKVKEPQFVYDHMEGQMVAKHLDRLLRQGLIACTPAGFQRLV
jgi:glyoxylase-like metal-dependent hydrolase (beta-lactamase superfamily II)